MARGRGFALATLLVIYITNQWSRYSIVYLGSVATSECPGKNAGDVCHFESGEEEYPLCPSYTCESEKCKACQLCLNENDAEHKNIKYGLCLSQSDYGFLVSYAYTGIFAVASLFAGRFSDIYNRKNLIVGAALAWCGFTVLQAASTSYTMVLISRIGMGLSHAMSGPASLSIIADLYAPAERAKSNGIYFFGVYVGGGLSSVSLAFSSLLGWRVTTFVISAIAAIGCAMLAFLVEEPNHEQFLLHSPSVAPLAEETGHGYQSIDSQGDEEDNDHNVSNSALPPAPKKITMTLTDTIHVAISDKLVLLLFLAAPIRFVGGFAIGTFLPQFYSRRFPDENNVYSTLNALIVSVGGAMSAYAGGYITDKLKSRNYPSAPGLVPAFSSLFALVPFIGVMYASDFYLSISCLFLEYLIAEAWFAPAMTILQGRVPGPARGLTISLYLFISGIIGSLAPALLGHLDDGASWTALRQNITLFVFISYVGSFVFFSLIGLGLKRDQNTN